MSEWISDRNPVPPHPFAHWIANDDWVIVSGTVGLLPDFTVPESAAAQTEAAIASLEQTLKDAGSGLHEIVLLKPTLVDVDDIPAVADALDRLLPHPRPAGGALIVVSALAAPMFKVELEVWAHKGAKIVAREASPTA